MIEHTQIDSGLGFECDEKIVHIVRVLNQFRGIKTQYSCQGGDTEKAYAILLGAPAALVSFGHYVKPHLNPYPVFMLTPLPSHATMEWDTYDIQFRYGDIPVRGRLSWPPVHTEGMYEVLIELRGHYE